MFDVPTEQGFQFRNQYDWLQNRPLVIYAGTLGSINGVDYLAKLAASVLPKNSDICFLVIGDGAEKPKVESIARQLGVFNKNFFMLDPIPKSQMPSALKAADMATSLFVDLPEMWANSANKFFDALASGTPVAINYHGWQAELLEENNAGIVLDANDTEAAAIILVETLQDHVLLTQAGEAARQIAVDRFSRDMLAKQLEDVLLTAVAEHK
jgi:glycosyltransferase involved in cell wall biosynthesis